MDYHSYYSPSMIREQSLWLNVLIPRGKFRYYVILRCTKSDCVMHDFAVDLIMNTESIHLN